MASTTLTVYGINEARPGPRWRALFDAVWPGYRRWYLTEGADARPDLATASARLEQHMPELVPTWRRLVGLTGDDPLAATMLTLWDPPTFAPGCSQVVVPGLRPALVRNYDYGPDLFESVVYSSRFGERRVIGTGDCLWGLLDGMNDAGLAVSLAYGGRPGSAPGFAAPLVVRYLLEVADTTAEAKRRLAGLPVSMSYNLTIVDAAGDATTAFVTPHEEPTYFAAAATNHRGDAPERPEHARRFRSVERRAALDTALDTARDTALDTAAGSGHSVEAVAAEFLRPPLFGDDYDHAFGTLYTAVYRPTEGEVDYLWRDRRWTRSFDSAEEVITVTLTGGDVPYDETSYDGAPSAEPTGSAVDWQAYAETSVAELGALTRQVVQALAHRPDQAAFAELLSLYEVLGVAMGESARTLAEHGSWSQVAGVAGVSRQAAWYRWRG